MSDFFEVSPHPQAVGHVFEYGFRKRVGFLKHHADPHPHFDGIHVGTQNVGVFGKEANASSLVAVAGIEVVHAVETAQEGRFSTTGGADEGGDFFLRHRQGDVF
jgi:hypothetical protein